MYRAAGIVDDAGVLSKASSGALVKKLANVEKSTGYKIEVVTVRKLVFEPDVFAFADQVCRAARAILMLLCRPGTLACGLRATCWRRRAACASAHAGPSD